MNEELKNVVEAILFAAARRLTVEEIAKLCKKPEQDVLNVLKEWKIELDKANTPTMLVEDSGTWRLTVREKYVPIIKKVVTKTEIPKSILETLAVVAYKVPILQSKVVKLRTNKAYEHLRQLENAGFITREKKGRSKLIKLTSKFYEYFDLDPAKLKTKFKNRNELEKAIEKKEKEIEAMEEEQREKVEEQLKKPEIVIKPETGKPQKLETYEPVQPVEDMKPTGVEVYSEEVDGMKVYEVEKKVEKPKKVEKAKPAVKKEVKDEKKVEEKKEKPEEKPEEKAEVKESEEKPEEKPAETVEEPPTEKTEEKKEETPEPTPSEKIEKETKEHTEKLEPKKFEEGKGLYPEGIPAEMEAKIEEKIKKLLTPEPKPEEKKDEQPEFEESEKPKEE